MGCSSSKPIETAGLPAAEGAASPRGYENKNVSPNDVALVEARAAAAKELLAINEKQLSEKDARIAELERAMKALTELDARTAKLESFNAELENALKAKDALLRDKDAQIKHLTIIVGATSKWSPPAAARERISPSPAAAPPSLVRVSLSPGAGGGISAKLRASGGSPKGALLWRKVRMPIMLRLRAAAAFQESGSAFHSRQHAVDEADTDRPLQDGQDSSLLLGSPLSRDPFSEAESKADMYSRLSSAQKTQVDEKIAELKAELTTILAMEAAKHSLGRELRLDDAKPLRLQQGLDAALARTRNKLAAAKPPVFEGSEDGVGAIGDTAAVIAWRQKVAALLRSMRSNNVHNSAAETGGAWAKTVMKAVQIVIQPNEARLTEHMESMRTEHMNAAKRDLTGSRLRSVYIAHALFAHRQLKGAMDDVARQFREGMRSVLNASTASDAQVMHQPSGKFDPMTGKPIPKFDPQTGKQNWYDAGGGSGDLMPPPTEDQSTEQLMCSLYSSAVEFYVESFMQANRLNHSTIEMEIMAGMQPQPLSPWSAPRKNMRMSIADVVLAAQAVKAKIESDPISWLKSLILGDEELPLDRNVRDWLSSALARYLDPFIDGEVPANQYQTRSEGFIIQRLEKQWKEREESKGTPMAIESYIILAQYARHAITKMNTNLGFSQHTPGLGRQPVSDREMEAHLEKLGKALVAAIERDFGPDERAIGSLADGIEARHVVSLGRVHWNGLVLYQAELGNSLAAANREGEENRREERMRIWGYA